MRVLLFVLFGFSFYSHSQEVITAEEVMRQAEQSELVKVLTKKVEEKHKVVCNGRVRTMTVFPFINRVVTYSVKCFGVENSTKLKLTIKLRFKIPPKGKIIFSEKKHFVKSL